MSYQGISQFLRDNKAAVSKGPVAVILLEDDVEATSTVAHHLACGFAAVVVVGSGDIVTGYEEHKAVFHVVQDTLACNALTDIINPIIARAPPGCWIYYCYNAEYLFYPFSETRCIGEFLAFCAEERRASVVTFTIDLYAGDLVTTPHAVAGDDAYLDASGFYALARYDQELGYLDRQHDFYGGLRWRFEEHVPYEKRRIDRVGLFRAKSGLNLREDHTFDDMEYNTYACEWHHSPTAAICSFRAAKALKRNPGSTTKIATFTWGESVKFSWTSGQLLDLGFMEAGQWF